jgi:hypothetical protein
VVHDGARQVSHRSRTDVMIKKIFAKKWRKNCVFDNNTAKLCKN